LGPATVETNDGYHVFHLRIEFGDLSPESVRVELYADGSSGSSPERHVMTRETGPEESGMNGCLYSLRLPGTRPARDYSPRLIPHSNKAIVPLEAPQILWR
jgi:starch phosphorylase